MNLRNSTQLPIDIDFEAVQKTRLFQKFVEKEEAKARGEPSQLSKSFDKSITRSPSTSLLGKSDFNKQSQSRLILNSTDLIKLPQDTYKPYVEIDYSDQTKFQTLQAQNLQNVQQIDRLNVIMNELRRQAFDENHNHKLILLNLNDQIYGLQERMYQLQKSEDSLQMENENLRNRMNQETMQRNRHDEDSKEVYQKNNDLIFKLSQLEAQVQRQREDLVHTRTQSEQYKSDNQQQKQQMQMLNERNTFLESSVRNELLRKEMNHTQLLDCQERLQRGQNDQENLRSEILELRRQCQKQQVQDYPTPNKDYPALNKDYPALTKDYSASYKDYPTPYTNNPIQFVKKEEQFMKKEEYSYTPQKPVQDNSYDKYSKQQNQVTKQTQAQQGGQNYFKEKDQLQESNDREIKELESQLLNTQVKKQQVFHDDQIQKIASELKKLEASKIRTGANIKKKVELEQLLVLNEQQVVLLRNKLREMNALFM